MSEISFIWLKSYRKISMLMPAGKECLVFTDCRPKQDRRIFLTARLQTGM